ncbi:hypothetical protein VTN96DRAFT_4819 [Rasamsonia emersonii]
MFAVYFPIWFAFFFFLSVSFSSPAWQFLCLGKGPQGARGHGISLDMSSGVLVSVYKKRQEPKNDDYCRCDLFVVCGLKGVRRSRWSTPPGFHVALVFGISDLASNPSMCLHADGRSISGKKCRNPDAEASLEAWRAEDPEGGPRWQPTGTRAYHRSLLLHSPLSSGIVAVSTVLCSQLTMSLP